MTYAQHAASRLSKKAFELRYKESSEILRKYISRTRCEQFPDDLIVEYHMKGEDFCPLSDEEYEESKTKFINYAVSNMPAADVTYLELLFEDIVALELYML